MLKVMHSDDMKIINAIFKINEACTLEWRVWFPLAEIKKHSRSITMLRAGRHLAVRIALLQGWTDYNFPMNDFITQAYGTGNEHFRFVKSNNPQLLAWIKNRLCHFTSVIAWVSAGKSWAILPNGEWNTSLLYVIKVYINRTLKSMTTGSILQSVFKL